MRKPLAIVALSLFALACAVRVPPPRMTEQETGAPDKAWASVLSRFVDDKGRIDFAGMAKDPHDLEVYVSWLAKVSPAMQPSSFPTPESRLAFDINAYNALAMYNTIQSGMPRDLNAVKVRFFYKNRFQLGGSDISLYDFENKVIRPIGDPRVHFALNCMARGCPRLPREPFRAEMLDAELDASAQYFFSEDRNVKLEPDRKTVRLSQIMQFYTDDFLKKVPSLIACANKYRQDKIPEGWKVEFIPYDWQLNSQ
jgi:Protein of unknown function, DUF547